MNELSTLCIFEKALVAICTALPISIRGTRVAHDDACVLSSFALASTARKVVPATTNSIFSMLLMTLNKKHNAALERRAALWRVRLEALVGHECSLFENRRNNNTETEDNGHYNKRERYSEPRKLFC